MWIIFSNIIFLHVVPHDAMHVLRYYEQKLSPTAQTTGTFLWSRKELSSRDAR